MPISCFQFCMNGVKAREFMGFKDAVVPDDDACDDYGHLEALHISFPTARRVHLRRIPLVH